MTGNIVLMGIAVGQGQALSTVRSAVALAGFAAGVVVGAVVAGRGPDQVWPRRVTVALAIELVLLTLLALGWASSGGRASSPAVEALIATSALAMGVQTAATRRLAVTGVATTYVTGTLTSLVAQLTALTGSRTEWARWAAVLVALLLGAGAEAFGAMRWTPLAPVLPLLVVAAVVVLALPGRGRDETGGGI